jgi:hypothetical protein
MTQTTETGVQLGALRYRVTFQDTPSLSIASVVDRFKGLNELLYVATLLDQAPAIGSLMGDEQGKASQRTYSLLRQLRAEFYSFESQARVERISYNSPLDVMFHISAGAGMFYLSANRALALYEKWQDIRIKKATADRTKFDTAKYLREQLEVPLEDGVIEKEPALRFEQRREVRQQIKEAAATMESLSSFEQLPPL